MHNNQKNVLLIQKEKLEKLQFVQEYKCNGKEILKKKMHSKNQIQYMVIRVL